MKAHLLQKAFHTLTEAFQNCMRRFPVTVCFVLALTGYLLHLVATEGKGDAKSLFIWGYYLSVGTLLSLTLHLWCEEMKSTLRKVIIQVSAHVLFFADALFLYHYAAEQTYIELGIAHAAGILALGLSVFFLSFFKEKDDIPSWNFALHTITSFITAGIVGGIMSAGIGLLILSLHMLFDVDILWKHYLYILIICSLLLPAFLFLGMLPRGEEKHNREPQSLDFLNGIIRYLFLPLMGGYLLVLYVYTARILSSWTLPTGWVSWLVVTLMAGCIAIEFGLYPTRIKDGKRTDERIARWLPALVLPLLMLMTVGIVRRFNDYGVTINRLYLITLNIWFYLVCIGLIVTKARRINWIPISFAVIFLLTSALPVNYASITKNSLRDGLKEQLARTCQAELPLTRSEYSAWLDSLPEQEARMTNDRFRYLKDWFGRRSIDALVDTDVSFYAAQLHLGTETDEDKGVYFSYSGSVSSHAGIRIPAGYRQFSALQTKKTELPDKYVRDGLLPLSIKDYTGNKNDTVYISLKTLKETGEKENSAMSPLWFECTPGSRFVLTGFSLWYYDKEKNNVNLEIKGYLFTK